MPMAAFTRSFPPFTTLQSALGSKRARENKKRTPSPVHLQSAMPPKRGQPVSDSDSSTGDDDDLIWQDDIDWENCAAIV